MPTEAFASPLIVWLGPHRYTFPAGRDVTVGRDSRADIRLDGVGTPASPTHMVLHHDGRQWIAVDRSEGGIYVDGVRMSTVFIHDGRAITLGDPQHGPRLVFQLGAPPPPPPRTAPPHRCGRAAAVHHHHRGPFNTADRRFRPHRRARRPPDRHQIPHAGRRNRRRSGRRNHRHHRPPSRQRSRHHTPGHRKHHRSPPQPLPPPPAVTTALPAPHLWPPQAPPPRVQPPPQLQPELVSAFPPARRRRRRLRRAADRSDAKTVAAAPRTPATRGRGHCSAATAEYHEHRSPVAAT